MIRVLALCGGVGGAKLALGLSKLVPAEELAILVNTGDDFTHLGLHVSPDVDTVTYTLAGLANETLGWGLAGESWEMLGQLEKLGGETWFRLGDRDMALHLWRTARLKGGEGLGAITADAAQRLGARPHVWPMSEAPVRTVLETDEGTLPFQEYFVRRQAAPRVRAIRYEGAEEALPYAPVLAALQSPALQAVVLCPSNPWLSVAPMLAMPALRAALGVTKAPVVAVAPIVGGRAIKGPTAKLMAELGLAVTAERVAAFYKGLVTGYVLDEEDRALGPAVARLGMEVAVAPTIMHDLAARKALARTVLAFAEELQQKP